MKINFLKFTKINFIKNCPLLGMESKHEEI